MNTKKRVFIIHGWGGDPEEGWFPWLKTKLEEKGFEMFVPAMPDSEVPVIEKWVPFLASQVGAPDENTFFVGHSIGVQTILRYLQTIDQKIGGAVFVAGWFGLKTYEGEEEREIARPWIETPIDFKKVKENLGKSVAIFSDNDYFVDIESEPKLFFERFGSEIIIEKEKGHFSGSDDVAELPSALQSIFKLANKEL